MAWIIGAVGVGYLVSTVDDYIDEKLKPMYDYFETSENDKIQRDVESVRQEHINNKKYKKITHDQIRDKYNIQGSGFIVLNNNTNEICHVVYVNHYHAKNKEEAISWAKQVIDIKYFQLGLSNKLNTKKEIIGASSNLQLIEQEFIEYFIVLMINNEYMVLDQSMKKQIKISNLFEVPHDTNLYCFS
jgi:hypothetical protein